MQAQHASSEAGHETEQAEEEFNISSFALEHIQDSHEWHLWTTEEGHHVSIYLPVILYTKAKGLTVFMSDKIAHHHTHEGFRIMEEGPHEGRIVRVDEEGHVVEEDLPLDFSITKNVAGMMVAALILILLFVGLARSYRKTGLSAPRGIQGFLEPIILFIRDDVAIPNIGEKKYHRYMPYLLTVFFFILLNNLMGLIPFFPFGANVTGNIAVTLTLAVFTFIIVQFSGNKSYWRHIFATPGVPIWLLPIMIPVEIIGMFSKPFALMVRLFANITAGHIIVISLIGLIFMFQSIGMTAVSFFFVLFMDILELLVAFLQAFVFTLLSALFIGLAVPEEHH